ncbi:MULTISPECIES: class E sortase [unclassified Brevibacterium]|uniref:class E sortase n=1 Tax=unclassified Brevibacterium TaxID=2614124 RepID=UPI0010F7D6C5|nr:MULTISPECIES: class E sortase [unclassified Brevibacterium]MCM1013235.1 class E sortase [Brevibacterium sp. XM4083]
MPTPQTPPTHPAEPVTGQGDAGPATQPFRIDAASANTADSTSAADSTAPANAGTNYDAPLPSRRELRRREAAAAAGGTGVGAAAGTAAGEGRADAPPLRSEPTEAMPAWSQQHAQQQPQAYPPTGAQPTMVQPAYADTTGNAASPGAGYAAAGYAAAAAAPAAAGPGSPGGPGGPGGPNGPGGPGDGGSGGGRRKKQPVQRQPIGPIRGTIRTFGELCITAGLVLILFVVWQLWWTDLEANRDNEVLADQLTKDWANQDPNQLPDDPDEPVVAEPVEKNTAFGIFYIPRFGDDYYRTLAEGVDLEPVLNRMGVGRYPNSAMPGEVGNFSVAGHRVTYGKPFNQIAKLQPGDEIVVQTKDGFYTYTFRNFDIILPDAVEVLAPVPDQPDYKGKDRILTLTACNPMFSARERYIAYAELTEWRPAGEGPPDAIKDSKAYDKVSKSGGA